MDNDARKPEPLSQAMDLSRRFRGIARLYGERALIAFQRAHVSIIGIGGVGSWVVEALARSGVGGLTLIDLDHVSESNLNRQIHALDSTIGKAKVVAMRGRVLDINPSCDVQCVEDFVSPDNVETLIKLEGLDFVVDCTDQVVSKAAMASHCKRGGCPIVVVGGTGGQSDPTGIRADDLSRSIHDPLLAKTRRLLRRDYGFRRTGTMGVKCIFSIEQSRFPQPDGDVGPARTSNLETSLHCGGLGSATHLTASFGFAAVALVLEHLARRAADVERGGGEKTGSALPR